MTRSTTMAIENAHLTYPLSLKKWLVTPNATQGGCLYRLETTAHQTRTRTPSAHNPQQFQSHSCSQPRGKLKQEHFFLLHHKTTHPSSIYQPLLYTRYTRTALLYIEQPSLDQLCHKLAMIGRLCYELALLDHLL